MKEKQTTISYIGYEGKDEDTVYEMKAVSIPLEIGGRFLVTGLFVKERIDKENKKRQLNEFLDKGCS